MGRGQPVFLGRIFPLRMMVQRMGGLGQPGSVLDLLEQFQRGEILDAVWPVILLIRGPSRYVWVRFTD